MTDAMLKPAARAQALHLAIAEAKLTATASQDLALRELDGAVRKFLKTIDEEKWC